MSSHVLLAPRGRLLLAMLVLFAFTGIVLLVLDVSSLLPNISLPLAYQGTDTPFQNPSRIGHAGQEDVFEDGVKRYEMVTPGAESDLLWLVLSYDEQSWGWESDSFGPRQRSFEDFLHLLASTNLDPHNISLGLLTSSEKEYHHLIETTRDTPFARTTIFLHTGINPAAVSVREHRHDAEFQTARRAELGQLRNFLMLRTLHDEHHIVWLDADIIHLDQGIVQKMIEHSDTREDVGIITARCEAPWGDNYDLNAWGGPHKHAELVPEIVRDTTDDDLLPLTAVGGTLLYIRASLVSRGINFSPYYAVNTKWEEDGDDGIESEGMCYQARGMKDGGCFVLGGSWHSKHGD